MYVNIHDHLDHYKGSLNQAINKIKENNIITIACSTDIKTYNLSKSVSQLSDLVIPIFGIHPWNIKEEFIDINKYDEQIKESPMIGEIGLDFHWVKNKNTYKYQIHALKQFFQKSYLYGKRVNLHTKGAEKEIYYLIKHYKIPEPIIHWYSGDLNTLDNLISYGSYFSISADIKYSKLTDELIRFIPINKILTETDGPRSLEWINGKISMPDFIINIVEYISEIKKLPSEEVKLQIYQNFKDLKL